MTVRLLAVLLLALLGTGAPAHAAGVGGVELVPASGSSFALRASDGERSTASFAVRNIGAVRATVRLYAASAVRSDDSWAVGGRDSVSWVDLPAEELVLEPGQSATRTFTATGSESSRTAAVVLEQQLGSVVQRAATLVHVSSSGVVLSRAVVTVAVAAVSSAALGVLLAGLLGRRRPALA